MPTRTFPDKQKMPLPAFILAGAAAFPLTTLASMILMGIKVPGIDNAYTLMVYAAIVLTFMSAVHWGLAMLVRGLEVPGKWGHATEWRRYTASFAPALLAWIGLLLPVKAGAWVMIAAYCGMLLYDLRCTNAGEAPSWFPTLRWPLVLMAAGSLVAGIILPSG